MMARWCSPGLAVGLALIGFGSASTVAEEAAEEMRAMRSQCVGDYFRYCAGLNPNGTEVRTCFRGNRASLSQECSVAIDAYERRIAAARKQPAR